MSLIVMTRVQVNAKPGAIIPGAPHFAAREMACKHCGVLRIRSELLTALEKWRTLLGRPISIESGYRCPTHNAAVGGARDSMHMTGCAADPHPSVSHTVVQGLSLFSGIGWDRAGAAAGLVRHVDVRHVLGGSDSPKRPATWTYPR
jgi:hypothetical protein